MSNAATIETDDRLINIDVLGALRRRKWIGLAVAILGVAATIAIVMTMPATYRSTATILIEEPDVPQDLVKSTVSTYANERLQIIQQRVMTSQNLNAIIDRFGLYGAPQLQPGTPRSALVRAMRSQVALEVVSANISGQQQSRYRQQPQASIAFTLSFEHGNPTIAQEVASQLTNLYLAENNRSRQEKAAGTTQFLGEQAKKLHADVQSLEQRLLDLRSKYNGSLPEQFSMNTQMLNEAQGQLMQNRAELQVLTEKRAFLQNQLATVNPHLPVTVNGQPATPQAQLMSLELQYADLSSRYGSKHPDVVRLQRQIETLKAQLGVRGGARPSSQAHAALQSQLSDALQRYGESHPDVKRLRRQLDEMTAEMNAAPPAALTASQGPPDNPIYIQLQSQMADVNSQIGGLRDRATTLEANVEDLQQRILQTPRVEAEYNSLREQHTLALQRYQSFKDKEADAEVAETMEQQSKGETFSVIEPAQFPDIPEKPNRKLLNAVGIFLSGLLAAVAMLAVDMLDPRIFEPKSLLQAFGEMPLVTVPYIATGEEVRGRRMRLIGIAGGAVILIAGLLAFTLPRLPLG